MTEERIQITVMLALVKQDVDKMSAGLWISASAAALAELALAWTKNEDLIDGARSAAADAWLRFLPGGEYNRLRDPKLVGIMDSREALVQALVQAGLLRGGLYNKARDIMQFDYRSATIKR